MDAARIRDAGSRIHNNETTGGRKPMKHPVRKLICAVLVAVILLVPAWLSLQAAARASVREKEADRNVNRLKGLSTLFDRMWRTRRYCLSIISTT